VLRAICADQVSAELDVALEAKDWKALGAMSNEEAFKSQLRQWLKQRDECANASDISQCIRRHYIERLSQH
jgi:uncharacterized protein